MGVAIEAKQALVFLSTGSAGEELDETARYQDGRRHGHAFDAVLPFEEVAAALEKRVPSRLRLLGALRHDRLLNGSRAQSIFRGRGLVLRLLMSPGAGALGQRL